MDNNLTLQRMAYDGQTFSEEPSQEEATGCKVRWPGDPEKPTVRRVSFNLNAEDQAEPWPKQEADRYSF